MTRLNQLLCKTGALFFILQIGLSIVSTGLHAQTYTSIPVTGFMQDVVADTGTSTLAETSAMIDGNKNISNHVIYSQNFATINGLSGGIPNSGTISGTVGGV